jgi:hypothetical protein
MKTMKTRNGLILTICALLLGALSIYSCDTPISLGHKINMDPPIVTIERPDFMENIKGDLVISGTAFDNEEVAILYITVERISESGQDWKQECQSDRGVWQSRSAGGSWDYRSTDGSWSIHKDMGKVNVEWSILLSMEGAPNGEYHITVGAENNVKTKGPLQQRRVVIDNEPPVVSVLAPILYFDDYAGGAAYAYDTDVKPDFDTYILRDPAVLDRLHNKSIRIQYKIEDSFSIDTLFFQLSDQHGNIYYNQAEEPAQNISWSGNIDIFAHEIMAPSDNHVIGLGEKCYLQVISKASDKAGNVKTRSHGWLIYWPDADKPWVTGVGGAAPSDFLIFPGSDVQGQAYDNDGVQSVSYKIYKNDTSGVNGAVIQQDTLTNVPLVPGDPPTMFFSWGFKAPADSDEYIIVIDCNDMYGTAGDQDIRLFYVQSTSAPAVTVLAPNQDVSLFGDTLGNFTISGYTGNGESTGPVGLAMVWLNPNDTTGSRFEYQSSEYSGWSLATSGGYIDSVGNKIWSLSLDTVWYEPSTQRHNRDFSRVINLFSDLNIGTGVGKVPLTSQTFIFRVLGGNGITAVKSVSFRGDVIQPALDIDKIERTRGGGTVAYPIADLLAGQSMAVLEVNDKITISGTWGDDSFTAWNNVSRMVNPQVLWGNKQVPITLNTNGTWKAEHTLLTLAETQIGSVYITASIGDFGNNVTEKSVPVKVETSVPILMYITSDNEDGYYNAGKTITIQLEFNKAVTFTGANTLTLNSGGTATMTTSGAQLIHKFSYTVASGNTTGTNKLIVNSINYTTCAGIGGSAILNMDGRNLDKTKNIIIDNTAPTIVSVEALNGTANGTSYFNAGKDIYLLVKFSEDIKFTPTNPTTNNTILTLNSGGSGTNPAISGTNSLLFTYNVASGQNIATLTATGITLNGGVITDLAGNNAASLTTIPGGQNINNINNKNIVIDTTAPAAPTFTPSSIAGTFTDSHSFTINGESGAKLEYSVKGTGGPWISTTGSVNLTSAGSYAISARQTDLAGNVSPSSAEQTVIIKVNTPLLVSFGGTPGTYKAGDNIDIKVNMRGNVTLVNGTPRLQLGGDGASFTTTPAYANYNSGSGTSTLTFRYTVGLSDNVNVLKITNIDRNGANLTEGSTSVNAEFINPADLATKNLDYYTTIKIDTTLPAFTNASISGTMLTFNFNKEVYKGTGNITLDYQDAGRLAPAVLTKAEYQRYGGSALSTYYTVGTNGTDSSGNYDLTEKYILNYGTNTNDATLRSILTTNGAFKITVPVASGAVTGSGTTALKIDLSSAYGYVLPVKGVNYVVNFPAGLVQDSLGNKVTALSGTGTSFTNPGVNKPVIRVQKNKETFKTSGTVLAPTIAIVDTEIPVLPSGYWIQNAEIQISPSQPVGNWEKVDKFYIYLPAQTVLNLTTYGISIANPNDTKYIQLPAGATQHQGPLRSDGSGGYMRSYSDWINNGNRPEISPYWLNPYVNTIGQGDGDGREGATVISNAWVNTLTGTQNTSTSSPGTGWLRVTTGGGGSTTYEVELTVGAYTTPTVSSLTAEQPLQAGVKIDCQTPGAVINYAVNTVLTAPFAGPFNMGDNPKPAVSMPTSASTLGSTFNLGDAGNLNGYLYAIRADATSGGNTETAYEKAARSVIMFNNIAGVGYWSNLTTEAGNANNIQLWIRGGDDTSGSSLTPGFPLSWSDKDYKGIRCLTNAGATRYWVTWEVNTPAYFHFIAGKVTTAGEAADGPTDWSWAKNSWALQYREFPLYPGGSLVFYPTTRVFSPATSTLEFYTPFSGHRP